MTICFIGDFRERQPSAAAKAAFLELAAWLLHRHGLEADDVWSHREVASSNCPGDAACLWLRDPKAGRYASGVGLKELQRRLQLVSE